MEVAQVNLSLRVHPGRVHVTGQQEGKGSVAGFDGTAAKSARFVFFNLPLETARNRDAFMELGCKNYGNSIN